MTFSLETIRELLQALPDRRQILEEIYAQLPPARCQRRTSCCALLPEMSLAEAVTIFSILAHLPPTARRDLVRKILTYFLLNPVEIMTCPFLVEQDCLIYQDRFFGCRAYGLWSAGYYEELTTANKQAKTYLLQQWRNLGVELPTAVIHYQLPYCRHVVVSGDQVVDDGMIQAAWDEVLELSEQFAPWHRVFQEKYFSDPAFLIASLVFGTKNAVQLKFDIVRDIVATGDRNRLNRALEEMTDPLPF